MSNLPKHIVSNWGSARAFKQDKRQQIEFLRQSVESLHTGCAYLPNDGLKDVKTIHEAIKRLKDKCSIKKWGR